MVSSQYQVVICAFTTVNYIKWFVSYSSMYRTSMATTVRGFPLTAQHIHTYRTAYISVSALVEKLEHIYSYTTHNTYIHAFSQSQRIYLFHFDLVRVDLS